MHGVALATKPFGDRGEVLLVGTGLEYRAAVDTGAVKPFKTFVTLAEVKAHAKLKEMKLAREPRLSVQPVSDEHWKMICKMGGVD